MSVGAGKAFDEIQHPFKINRPQLGTEANYPTIIKAIHEKSTGNITLGGERLKALPL